MPKPAASLSRTYRSLVLVLVASYALLVIAVALAGRRMIDEIRDVEQQASDLYEHPFRANAACHQARLAASLIRSELLFVQMERTPTGLHLRLDVDELDHQLEAQLDLVEQYYLGDQQQVREARTLTGRWRERRIALMRLLDAGHYEDARVLTLTEISPLHDAVMQRLDAITDVTRLRAAFYAEEARRKAAESVSRMWTLLGLLVMGALLGAIGVTAVVLNQLRRRDRELAQERERIRLVADNVPGMATILLDSQGRVQTWNEGARRLHGYEADEMLGKAVDRLYPPEHAAGGKSSRVLAQAQANGFHEDLDWRMRKDGSRLFADVIVCPLRDEAGQLQGFLKISRDISERHRLEQDLIAARDRAETANRAKSGFLANMSHEVRTPLNAIIGLTQLVLDSPLNAEQRDFLGKVQRSSRALLGVLNDLLDYSKIEAGHLDIEHIDMSVEDVLRQSADLFMASIEQKGLEIFVEVDPALPRLVRGDPLRLSQVLNNLVGNAVKFTHQGEIRLRADFLGQVPMDPARVADSAADGQPDSPPPLWVELRFSVTDTGIGIAADKVEHLFQAFSQADESVTRKYGGTGLGLAICRHLVQLLGGQITVVAEPGQGSCFTFTARFEHRPEGEVQPDPARSALPAHLKVLVVDDQDASRQLLRRSLSAWQWEVDCVDSAEAGLARLRQAASQPYDLVLVDWIMPGMDGLAMARQIDAEAGADNPNRTPRVVMVTAHARDHLLTAAGNTRIDAVLVKPVLPSSLVDALARALRGVTGRDAPGLAGHPEAPGQDSLPPTLPSAALPVPSWKQAAASLAGRQVLVVEDNELSQAVAREFLQRAGLKVTCAGNGGEALLAVETEPFDIVLMDLHMPDMDGFEATRRIRALPGRARLPIIALTAAAMQDDRAAAHAAGMNAHLAKPIDPEALIDLLLEWLDPSRLTELTGTGEAGRPASAPAATPAPAPAATALRTAAPVAPQAAMALSMGASLSSAAPVLDRAAALDRMGGDAKVLARLLRRFAESYADLHELVADAVQAGNLARAIDQLHRVAGAGASLGLTDLGQLASRFEVRLRSQPAFGSQAGDDDLLPALAVQLGHAQHLIAQELSALPPASTGRQARLRLQPNGELVDEGREGQPARVSATLAPHAAAAELPDGLSGEPPAPLAADGPPPAADDGPAADAEAMADPMKAQRRQAARRLQATLEQIKPLLHEHDLVPRDLLDRLDRHGEDWAITLDPRAAPGEPGSVVDAAPVVDGLAHLGESLDAYDYPAAEAALDLALSQLRSLHA